MNVHLAHRATRSPAVVVRNQRPCRTSLPILALVLWLIGAAPAVAQVSSQVAKSATVDTTALLDDARRFMESYARDLRAGDRAALAARYDRAGAFRVGMGQKALQSQAAIAA